MTTLTELMKRDDVRASWFYTHTEDGQNHGGNHRHDFDMYDVVFSRDNGISLYGGRMNRDHVMIHGVSQSPVLSRQNQGDRLVKPDATAALADLLTSAVDVDNHPVFGAWVREVEDPSSLDSLDACERALADFQLAKDRAAALRSWLGDDYDTYVKAAAAYLAHDEDDD